MVYTFLGPRAKVDRAQEQLRLLGHEIEAVLSGAVKPYQLRANADLAMQVHSVTIHIASPPPLAWSVRVGEIVHNLRSALDHMVYEMILTATGQGSDWSEFPIFLDRSRYDHARTGGVAKTRGLRPEAVHYIEQIQPWNKQPNPELHRLWALHQLSIADKHRLLHLTSLAAGCAGFSLVASASVSLAASRVRPDGPVQDGDELARWQLADLTDERGHVKVEGDITYGIAFSPDSPWAGNLVVESLQQLVETVEGVGGSLSRLP